MSEFGQVVDGISKSVDGFFNDYTGWFVSLIFKSVPIGEASFPLLLAGCY